MGISGSLSQPLYSGAAITTEVPGRYAVALGGRGFMLDTESNEHRHASLPLIRAQADQGDLPGGQSLNPEDLWRRPITTWHLGSGQALLDASTSVAGRFRSSRGINPWVESEISLLNTTTEKRDSANDLELVVVGTYAYLIDGQTLLYSTDLDSWTTVTGTPAATATSIATDGYNVWVAYGANGIYSTTRGAATASSYVTGSVSLVRYVKGRLMAANTNSLYNITAGGALPTALLAHSNTDFAWTDLCEGVDHIYAAGYSGDRSLIYKTAVKPDGTALDVPAVAGNTPDGETVRSLTGYLGFVMIGSDLGLRFSTPNAEGDLAIGGLIETDNPVLCAEGQDRFVWYGLTDAFTGTDLASGLGRLDLSQFNDTRPAYATDLMAASTSGDVSSVVTFGGSRVFTVDGEGVYAETTTALSSGTIDSGDITFDLVGDKSAHAIDTDGDASVSLSADGSTFTPLGTGASVSARQKMGKRFEIRMTVTGTVRSAQIRAYPLSARSEVIIIPLLLGTNLEVSNQITGRDPADDLSFIKAFANTQQLVTYQEGGQSYAGIVEEYEWRPHHRTEDYLAWNGTCVVRFKQFAAT